MTSYRKGEQNGANTIPLLRLLFVCLSVACMMQIVHESRTTVPSAPVYYKKDVRSSNLRRLDIDVPMYSHTNKNLHRDPISKPTIAPIPKLVIEPLFRQEQDRIDYGMDDASRCAQYNVEALPDDKKYQRRIFFGSMLANENAEVMLAHAIEVYNKYSVIALVESNTTHNGEPRLMHYGPGSTSARAFQESEMFGTVDHTKVVFDYWLEDKPFLQGMAREVEQRNTIWKIWVDQGMTERDVGIMADLDEVVSRDFLNALQVCDFPKLRHDPYQRPSCQKPKMNLSTIQFEASPLCVNKKIWFHPDLLPGFCIEGIGDPTGRVTPERVVQKIFGSRTLEWGLWDYKRFPQDVIDNNRFPLYDGRDIREVNGSDEDLVNFKDVREKGMGEEAGETAVFGTAYHLHNWFKDMEVLRHKFATYGHYDPLAKSIPLSEIVEDIDMLVRCVRGLGNDVSKGLENKYKYYENNALLSEGEEGIFSLGGNRPIYFKNRAYIKERHALVREMVRADEEKYGTPY